MIPYEFEFFGSNARLSLRLATKASDYETLLTTISSKYNIPTKNIAIASSAAGRRRPGPVANADAIDEDAKQEDNGIPNGRRRRQTVDFLIEVKHDTDSNADGHVSAILSDLKKNTFQVPGATVLGFRREPSIGQADAIRPVTGKLRGGTKVTVSGHFRDYGGLRCKFTKIGDPSKFGVSYGTLVVDKEHQKYQGHKDASRSANKMVCVTKPMDVGGDYQLTISLNGDDFIEPNPPLNYEFYTNPKLKEIDPVAGNNRIGRCSCQVFLFVVNNRMLQARRRALHP